MQTTFFPVKYYFINVSMPAGMTKWITWFAFQQDSVVFSKGNHTLKKKKI